MKKQFYTHLALFLLVQQLGWAQGVGINIDGSTADNSAMLEVKSSNKGMLIPRVNLLATNNISPMTSTPLTSLLVYNQVSASSGTTAVYPGFYYWNGSVWVPFVSASSAAYTYTGGAWQTSGGGGTSPFERDAVNGEVQPNTTIVNLGSDHFVFGSQQLDDAAGPTDDSRMYFRKGRGAFRAGLVTGTQWDNGNTGDLSVAFGNNTIAAGNASFVWGLGNTAMSTAGWSFVGGSGNKAQADGSFLMGQNNQTTAYYGVAFGYNNNNFGYASFIWGSGNTVATTSSQSMVGGSNNQATADNSFVMGQGNQTTNYYAAAFGANNVNSGYASFAWGTGNTVTSLSSYSMIGGTNNQISADGTFSIGNNNRVTAGYGVATGSNNINNGSTSFVWGNGNTALSTANYAMVGGSGNQNSADATFAAGQNNRVSGFYGAALGYANTVSGQSAFSAGQANTVSALNSTGFGNLVVASGQTAFAAGYAVSATGVSSVALGQTNRASGNYSFAGGQNNTASGQYTTAFGIGVTATGDGAVAMGSNTSATGTYAVALGNGTLAPSFSEVALGANNSSYIPSSPSSWASNDRLFVVGSGSSTGLRADAMVVYKSGNILVGDAGTNASTNVKLEVDGALAYTAVTATSVGLAAPQISKALVLMNVGGGGNLSMPNGLENGQKITLINQNPTAFTAADGGNMQVPGASITVGQYDAVTFIWVTGVTRWICVSFSDN